MKWGAIIKQKNYSIVNANGSYRVPIRDCELQIYNAGGVTTIIGDIANRIGEYEAIGTIDEFKRLKGVMK